MINGLFTGTCSCRITAFTAQQSSSAIVRRSGDAGQTRHSTIICNFAGDQL